MTDIYESIRKHSNDYCLRSFFLSSHANRSTYGGKTFNKNSVVFLFTFLWRWEKQVFSGFVSQLKEKFGAAIKFLEHLFNGNVFWKSSFVIAVRLVDVWVVTWYLSRCDIHQSSLSRYPSLFVFAFIIVDGSVNGQIEERRERNYGKHPRVFLNMKRIFWSAWEKVR